MKNWIHSIVTKNIDSVYYKCDSCVYQTLNKDIVERNCECGLVWQKNWKNIQWESVITSKKQTITNFFKLCYKEKPSSETSKSCDLSLMDQVNLQPNVVCSSSDKPFHPPKNFKFPEKRFGKETFNRSCQSQWFEDHQSLHYV